MNSYFASDRTLKEKFYIANGVFVKEYLDKGLYIYDEFNNDELVAAPPGIFYDNIYAETGSGIKIVATPEDGWIGLR